MDYDDLLTLELDLLHLANLIKGKGLEEAAHAVWQVRSMMRGQADDG